MRDQVIKLSNNAAKRIKEILSKSNDLKMINTIREKKEILD